MAARKREAWEIEYSRRAERHIADKSIVQPNERGRLRDEIEAQLRHQPNVRHTHRKPMTPNPTAGWELWVDPLRVYYDLVEAEHVLYIRAIGRTQGNEVWFGGEEVLLHD